MRQQRAFVFVAMAVLATIASASADAGDWEGWRGPNANGVSPETGWSPALLTSGDRVSWRANVGLGHSAVAVRADRLYTIGSREVRARGSSVWEDVVYCLDADTGKEVWRYSYPIQDKRWPGPGSTPVLDGNRLFTLSWQGHLYCFDAASGAVMWMRNIVADGIAVIPQWGFCASPVVVDNLLLLNAGVSGVALDKRNGKVVWASEPEAGGLATPVVYSFGNKKLATIGGNSVLHTVDVTTGEVVWSQPWASYADPVLVGDSMLLSGGQGAGRRGSRLLKFGPGEPEEVWQNSRSNNAFQSWVVLDGHGYGFRRSRSDQLECLDLSSGEVRWSHDMGDWGSLIAADGKLIVVRGDGQLVIAAATPEAYREIASARVFQLQHWQTYPDGRPNTVWTAPVLSNGRIFARTTGGDLACIDLKS